MTPNQIMSAFKEAAMAESEVGPIITSQHDGRVPVRVVVVGAGGTGGRLIPPLMQVLKRGDTVAIVDGDHVEDRNLARQNFRSRDVGENKAEVMARRYRREGIEIEPYAAMLAEETWREVVYRSSTLSILLGCVDSPDARGVIKRAAAQNPSLWIDGGNEMRGGQVLLSAASWPMKVRSGGHEGSSSFFLHGLQAAMPQLLVKGPWHCDRCQVDNEATAKTCQQCKQPEASCRDRIDLQTVTVNQLSATCMLNVLSCVLYKLPMTTCGAFFSTLNSMSPIKLSSVDWERKVILPETTYAAKD